MDAAIARLDLALARAGHDPRDPIASHELNMCVAAMAAEQVPAELDAELGALLGQAIAAAQGFEPGLADSREALRVRLFDIAAAISVRTRD